MSYNLGDLVVFSQEFLNASGVDADPTVVTMYLREEIDGTELLWIFNAVPVSGVDFPAGMNAMVKDSAGHYHVSYVARKPERLTAQFTGSGNSVNQSDVQTAFVRHSGVVALDHP